jgi:LruC domain-containing protein
MRTLKLVIAAAVMGLGATALAADSDSDGVEDSLDAFPCDSSAASVLHIPGDSVHGMLMFEDLWPHNGDLDFNDAIVTYNYIFRLDGKGRVTSLQLNLNLLAVGASVESDVWLRLPIRPADVRTVTRTTADGTVTALTPEGGEQDAVLRLVENTRSLFSSPRGFVNTEVSAPVHHGQTVNVQVELRRPVSLPLVDAPFDLFIARSANPGHQIHLPQYAGTARMDRSLFGTGDDASTGNRHFVNGNGLPFALNLPVVTVWPRERVPLDLVFPDVVRFASSGGRQARAWYTSQVNLEHAFTQGSDGSAPPVPLVIGSPVAPDRSCTQAVYSAHGVVNDLPLSSLVGWSLCHAGLYSQFGTSLTNIRASCDKPNLLLACRRVGSAELKVAAQAHRSDVFFDTGIGNTPHNANGVGWYYSPNWSWGFAPEGAAILRLSCDINGSGWMGRESAENNAWNQRLCWHTFLNAVQGGWRCGDAVGLSGYSEYERLIFEAD